MFKIIKSFYPIPTRCTIFFSGSIIRTSKLSIAWSNHMLGDFLGIFLGSMWARTKYIEMTRVSL